MAKLYNYAVILATVFCVTLILNIENSRASVLIEDIKVARESGNSLTSGSIESSSAVGNYEIVACGAFADGANPFNPPVPAGWEELVNLECQNPNCQLGVWGRVVNSTQAEEITCSWMDGSAVFVAGTIRYSGVDTENPIIDIVCSERVDGSAFAIDGASSEPGAQILAVNLASFTGADNQIVNFDSFDGFFNTSLNVNERLLSLGANSNIDLTGAGTEGFIFPFPENFNTRFCTITIRMLPTEVPTLSEWSYLALVLALGVIGLITIRRRRVASSLN